MANGNVIKIDTQDNLDERLRKKLNTNFSALKSAVERAWKIATDPYYHFDVVYPVGCLIWTKDEKDPRLSYGTWEKIEDKQLISAGPGHPVGTDYQAHEEMSVITSVSGEGVSSSSGTVHGRPAITTRFLFERTA